MVLLSLVTSGDDVESLLFLVHRIPYPPNKGDKIRSYHLLRHLARTYRVHLGGFVDEPDDWRHVPALKSLCHDLFLVGIQPKARRVVSLSGFLRGEALSLPYYRSRRLQAWVNEKLVRENVQSVLVFSSTMAQYVLGDRGKPLHRVIDFVDVDSQKWHEYGQRMSWPMSWLYGRESHAMRRFERDVAAKFDACVFVTKEEADLFRAIAPDLSGRLTEISNGVDKEYFSPSKTYENPYPAGGKVLVFTGAMDYWANADAVAWFAREVLPLVRARVTEARFFVVGARPVQRVRGLAALPGVQVVGAVEDIRPYLAYAQAAVAPLRVARGIQNKVLEAMAMARPVVATRAAMEGLRQPEGLERFVAEEPEVFAARCAELLMADADELNSLGMRGREFVSRHYQWEAHLKRFDDLLGAKDLESTVSSGVVRV